MYYENVCHICCLTPECFLLWNPSIIYLFHTSLLSFSCYHFQTAVWMASACPAQNQAEVTTVYQLGTLLLTDCSLQRQYMHPFQSEETGYSIQKQHFPGPHREGIWIQCTSRHQRLCLYKGEGHVCKNSSCYRFSIIYCSCLVPKTE